MKKYTFAFYAILIALINMSPVAQADDFQDKRWYVAGFSSFVGADSHRGAGDGWGGGLGIGKVINEHFNIELKGFGNVLGDTFTDANAVGDRTCSSTGGGIIGGTTCTTDDGRRRDLTVGGGILDVQYYFFRDTFSPYVVVGAGIMNTDKHIGNVSALGFVGEAGAGLTYALGDNFMLRSDIRYRYNNNFNRQLNSGTDEFHDFTVNFGFVYQFGSKS